MDKENFFSRMSAGVDHMAHIEPGEYTATCVRVHEPFEFKQYNCMRQRLDFAIEEDGTVLKKYVNLGPSESHSSESPWETFSSRSEYFKVWAAATGRRPKAGERITLEVAVGIRFTVTVVNKEHRDDGYIYSKVGKVRPLRQRVEHPEYTLSLNNSVPQSLNDSVPQSLNDSATQDVVLESEGKNRAVYSGTQDVGHAETRILSDSATQDGTLQDSSHLPRIYAVGNNINVTKETLADWKRQYPYVKVEQIITDVASQSVGNPFPNVEAAKDAIVFALQNARSLYLTGRAARAA